MIKDLACVLIIIHFIHMAMLTVLCYVSLGMDKLTWWLLGYLGILAVVIILGFLSSLTEAPW